MDIDLPQLAPTATVVDAAHGQDRQSRLLRTVSCGQEGKSLLDGLVRSACILPCAGDGRRGEGGYGLEIKVVGLHSSIRAAVVKTGDIGLAKVMESGGQEKKRWFFINRYRYRYLSYFFINFFYFFIFLQHLKYFKCYCLFPATTNSGSKNSII